MKYKIAGEIVAAEDLIKLPDAKLWIKAIQKARRNAIKLHLDITYGGDFDTDFERELNAVGVEIVE